MNSFLLICILLVVLAVNVSAFMPHARFRSAANSKTAVAGDAGGAKKKPKAGAGGPKAPKGPPPKAMEAPPPKKGGEPSAVVKGKGKK
ncbi:hypothetical protein B484DRAFT_448083 [Ochromonadaceae sp. CCMP2298]|nr:hypothetical protein B484DRAFT_448083 [Ochromonadaceae sp. CCMP2298]|mmetsp:Transcript_31090/g.66935  ORF Transcript_31090/g.66935 Transcript_31090/m.66935 type:complete len:88 (-) Transcript_31090:236-499(-)